MDTAVYDRVSRSGSTLDRIAVRRAISDVLGMWPREEFVQMPGRTGKRYSSTQSVITISAIGNEGEQGEEHLAVYFERRDLKSNESVAYSVRYAVADGVPVRDGALESASKCRRVPGSLSGF